MSKKKLIKLKPCPYCGGKVKSKCIESDMYVQGYEFQCDKCYIVYKTRMDCDKKAAKLYNKRPVEEQLRALIKKSFRNMVGKCNPKICKELKKELKEIPGGSDEQ